MNTRHLIALVWLACGSIAVADEESIPASTNDGCMEGPLEQFGRYIGNWDIEDTALKQDGSGWQPGAGAKWNFVCIGNGTAIQDFWMPNGGGIGTNLRTWDPDTETWDIAWAAPGVAGFAHITAALDDDGNIVMHWKDPVPDPPRRIIFYPPDDNGWDWVQEWSMDGGETWFAVYRIKATPSE